MAGLILARIPRPSPSLYRRHSVPLLGQLGSASSHGRDNREDDSYARAQALVAQTRDIHVTRRNESSVLFAGAGIAVSAMAVRYGLQEYNKYKASRPEAKEDTEAAKGAKPADGEASTAPLGGSKAGAGGLFGAFGKRHYEGGFEEKMTRKEAALVLGVRESAAPQRIKDSHRRILMINHPDKGGSKYMAAKINEAKEILLKGRGS